MSIFGFIGNAAADMTGEDAAEEVEAVGGTIGGLEDMDGFPLTWPVATGTDPKVFTPSDLVGGTAAGEEDIGAETSFIDPKVTAEPVYRESR